MALTSSRMPSILNPYVCLLSKSSLTLITSVLDASSNWLLLQFLSTALACSEHDLEISKYGSDCKNLDLPGVVFVSFLRDWRFWRDTARRHQCDLQKYSQNGQLVYVDGLSQLFTGRGSQSTSARGDENLVVQDSSTLAIEKAVLAGVARLKTNSPNRKSLLLVDGIDLVLASTGGDSATWLNLVSNLRAHVHASIVTSSADYPLMQPQKSPLEKSHAGFVAGLAHQARVVLSLRLLSTGVAKDVSGVIRATKGPGIDEETAENHGERELLYYVSGDGNVTVFERGE